MFLSSISRCRRGGHDRTSHHGRFCGYLVPSELCNFLCWLPSVLIPSRSRADGRFVLSACTQAFCVGFSRRILLCDHLEISRPTEVGLVQLTLELPPLHRTTCSCTLFWLLDWRKHRSRWPWFQCCLSLSSAGTCKQNYFVWVGMLYLQRHHKNFIFNDIFQWYIRQWYIVNFQCDIIMIYHMSLRYHIEILVYIIEIVTTGFYIPLRNQL